MCYYITIAVSADRARLLRDFVPHDFKVTAGDNRSVQDALPADYRPFLLITEQCSCDLYNSPEVDDGEDPEIDQVERRQRVLRRRYKRKGWSEAKVARAIRESLAARPEMSIEPGLRPDVKEILIALAAELSPFALLVHWYDGRISEEKITLRGVKRLGAKRLVAYVLPVDVLLWVEADDAS